MPISMNGGAEIWPTVHTLGIDRMSRDQRIALVLEIWETVRVEEPSSLLTDTQRNELRLRVAEDDASPEDVVPWEQVKALALARLNP